MNKNFWEYVVFSRFEEFKLSDKKTKKENK